MLPTERTRGAAAAAIQPSAPASQQLFQDKERQVQRPAPAGTRGAPLSGEEGAGAGVYLFHLPIARGEQAGTALSTSVLPPSPAGLHRSLESFIRSFPRRPKYIDSEHGVVLLHSTGVFTARAEYWGGGLDSCNR